MTTNHSDCVPEEALRSAVREATYWREEHGKVAYDRAELLAKLVEVEAERDKYHALANDRADEIEAAVLERDALKAKLAESVPCAVDFCSAARSLHCDRHARSGWVPLEKVREIAHECNKHSLYSADEIIARVLGESK